MSELRRYPEYKDSGVLWLGDIPSHWEVSKLKYLGEIILGLTYSPEDITDADKGKLVLRSSNVQNAKLSFKDNVYVESEIPTTKLTTDQDILICSRNGSRSLIGKNALITGEAIGQTFGAFMTVYRTPIRSFIYFFLNSEIFKYQIGSFLTSTINQLTTSNLGRFEISLPPPDEQQAIVNFLDDKLDHIDTLISKQQQLIEKLAEQRSAVITHAVTKGLDPDAAMKDSGVEWLGDIPEHWESFKITHIVETIGSGTTPKSSHSNYYADEGTLWVTTSELRESVIADTKKKLTEDALQDYSTLKVFPINSVAIAMYGATIGRLGILGEEATFNQACCVYSESEKIHYKFLYYWLWYRRPILISLSNGGGQPNLNQDDLRKLVIPIPSIKEQEEIVNYLDKETQRIDEMSKATTDIITKLQEYRSALITQAVTGKIDVRYLNQQAS